MQAEVRGALRGPVRVALRRPGAGSDAAAPAAAAPDAPAQVATGATVARPPRARALGSPRDQDGPGAAFIGS